MKKLFTSFVLFGLFFLPAINAVSQTVLEYDFYSKRLTYKGEEVSCDSKLRLKKCNGGLQVKVININTLLYNIEITIDDKELNNVPPTLLTQHFPSFGGGGNKDSTENNITPNDVTTIKTLKDLAKEPVISESIRKLISQDLIDLGVIDVSSLPKFCKGDLVVIKIKITPKETEIEEDKLFYSVLKGGVIELEIEQQSYWDVSFSSGFSASLLFDDKYNSSPNFAADTIQSYSIRKESLGSVVLGPTALMHISRKTKSFAWGGHIGVSVPITEKANPQYLIGGSILFGNKNRLGLSVSYAYGQVKRISETTDLNRAYVTEPTINMIDKWEGNLAFSITYNIFNP